ncbi:MAG: carbohydrate kinase family protein [Patescibacteria group bacterium]|nr:carbohydrate kinase family protein [Patescibacteria group bacterium]
MRYDIITIGSVTHDTFLKAHYPLERWPKAPSGKALVLPFGEKLEVDDTYATMGGNSANASVTFARQGFRTACFGKVGVDLPGRAIRERLESEGVTSLLALTHDRGTASSVLLLENGERTILGYHGASDTLSAKDIPWNKLKSAWWYLSLAGKSDVLLKPLMRFAKKNNIRVAFNPSGYHIRHRRADILSVLKDVSFLVVNTGEAADLVKIPFRREKEVFAKLDKLVPGIVAVTDGPNGVVVSDGTHRYRAGTFTEKRIADRTGAGDAFGSGFVAGLMKKSHQSPVMGHEFGSEDIKYAIRLATANATSVVERVGASEGTLSRSAFMNRRWKNLPISVTRL